MDTSRREFAIMASAATAAAMPAARAAAAATAQQSPVFSPKAWHQRVKRIMQINFTERDPERFDVERWADYLASIKCECTFVSITNMVAFYPTALPDFPVSRWLKGRDILGECVAAARKRNIRVVGRLSIDTARIELEKTHPDWFRRRKDGTTGNEIPGWFLSEGGDPSGSPDYAPTCQFSSYYSEFVPKLMDEVMTRYALDGIYTNAWPWASTKPCYCKTCHEIGEPGTEAYRKAYQDRVLELYAIYEKAVRRRHSDAIFSGNLGVGIEGGDLDLKVLTKDAVWMFADNQGRHDELSPSWDAAQQGRVSAALIGSRPVVNSTASYEFVGNQRWRTVTGNPDEVRSRLFQTLATGGTMHLHWIGYDQGFNEDRRWQAVGREVMTWQADNAAHFMNTASLAKVALVVSPQGNRLYKAPAGTETMDSFQGAYKILNEQRIPFDVVLDSELSREQVARFDVLILPNMALMSDAQARQIKDFVSRGGSVLTTFETGLYDESGKPRADFALADVAGVRKVSAREGYGADAHGGQPRIQGAPSMQRIERQHPVVAGFRDTNWIQGSSWRIPITVEGPAVLTHLPQHAVYPVEAVFGPRQTDMPTIALRERGTSRIVHLAGDIEAGYWRSGAADLGDLFSAALRWLIRDRLPLTVEGDGLVEVTGWQTEPGYAVHLVNHSNPNFRGAAFRQTVPLSEQRVRLTLPRATPIRAVRLLRAGQDLPVSQEGRVVTFTIPRLGDYEVAALTV